MFVGGGFLTVTFPKTNEVVLGKRKICCSVPAAILLVIPYIVWAGFRTDYFGDTGAHRWKQSTLRNNFHPGKGLVEEPILSANTQDGNMYADCQASCRQQISEENHPGKFQLHGADLPVFLSVAY